MKKELINNGITTFPMPAAVISVGVGEEANLITLAYVGKVCLDPPIIAISIQPKRHSYQLIEAHGEFVINYPSKDQLKEMDYCGTRSGRNFNKWEELGLTKEIGEIVKVPMIKEFPWNMECIIENKLELGSHVCYLGRVVAVHSDPQYLKDGNIDPDKLECFAYISGNYLEIKKGALLSNL
jgi:flavin reductase (DIM6/NTAB) family NADH-FMN oxidoreductase RutF